MMKGAGLLPPFEPATLFENLGVKPVEEDKAIGKEQNPGEDCERFIEALEERGVNSFFPVNLGKDVG